MDAFEVIGAFVDRERVDPERLKRALSTDEGREYLVDLVALREITETQAPGFEPPAAKNGSWPRLLALAAAIVLSVAGGYMVGHRQARIAGPSAMPVRIDRPAPVDVIPAAPTPTTNIKLEPGVDWKEATGG